MTSPGATGFTLLGVAREPWDDDGFRRHAAQRLRAHAPDLDTATGAAVATSARYRSGDVSDAGALKTVLDGQRGPLVIYLALPTGAVAGALAALADIDLPAGSRVVIEKPFGRDLAEARRLNALVRDAFTEERVFRLDHFLGKQTVLNLLGLRFANRIWEPVWNGSHISRVDLVWDETCGVQGRAGYYDRAGALPDMLQNHLLQLLCLVGMEPPTRLDEPGLRDRKVDLLRAARAATPHDAVASSRRARYTAGRAGDRELPSYGDEPGVDPERETETYAEMTVFVDNWRWSGVPFRLQSGKALERDRREIVVRFTAVPHLPFTGGAEPDVLRFTVDPDAIALELNLNGAGDPFALERTALRTDLARPHLDAYSLLLAEILDGDPTLSIRGDEAEQSWRIVEPVLASWSQGSVPLEHYPAGSSGPPGPAQSRAGSAGPASAPLGPWS